MPKSVYNLDESLGYLVGRAGRSLGARLNHNFQAAGFDTTCEQWSILVNLGERNGQSQQELASHTCKDKTSMTRLIDGMEKRNLVVRVPDKNDRRQKLIYLTSKGKEFHQKLAVIVKATLLEAEEGISMEEMKRCKTVLTKIYNNMAACCLKDNGCNINLKKKKR